MSSAGLLGLEVVAGCRVQPASSAQPSGPVLCVCLPLAGPGAQPQQRCLAFATVVVVVVLLLSFGWVSGLKDPIYEALHHFFNATCR